MIDSCPVLLVADSAHDFHLQLCLAGRETLTSAYAWRMFRTFNVKPDDKCSTPEICARHIKGFTQWPATRPQPFQGTRVLSSLQPVLDKLHQSQLICKECQKMLVARDKTTRRMLWEQMPKMLKLEVEWPPFEDSGGGPRLSVSFRSTRLIDTKTSCRRQGLLDISRTAKETTKRHRC